MGQSIDGKGARHKSVAMGSDSPSHVLLCNLGLHANLVSGRHDNYIVTDLTILSIKKQNETKQSIEKKCSRALLFMLSRLP